MHRHVMTVLAFALFAATTSHAQLAKEGTFTLDVGTGWSGTNYAIGDNHIYWIGELRGSVFNREGKGFLHGSSVICPAWADIEKNGVVGGGSGVGQGADRGKRARFTWPMSTKRTLRRAWLSTGPARLLPSTKEPPRQNSTPSGQQNHPWARSSNRTRASVRSGVSNPSVNQP